MYKSEQELMEELMESIYSGNVDKDDSDEKEKKDAEEKEDKEETPKEKDSESGIEDVEDEGEAGEDEGETEDEEATEKEETEEGEEVADSDDDSISPKAGGAFKSQVKSLQKQYNDLLTDAFEKYAPECIEDALDEVDSAFGENIEDILDLAMQKLKDKILGDLGVEGSIADAMPPAAMGSFDPLAGTDRPMEISIEKGE